MIKVYTAIILIALFYKDTWLGNWGLCPSSHLLNDYSTFQVLKYTWGKEEGRKGLDSEVNLLDCQKGSEGPRLLS